MSGYQLPKKIDHLIHKVAAIYGHRHETTLQSILVNGQVRIEEGAFMGGFNDEDAYHNIYLTLPKELYLETAGLPKLRERISKDLREHDHTPNEAINNVIFEMETGREDWRMDTGLLMKGKRIVTSDVAQRIWGPGFRLFLSHKSEVKVEVAKLKAKLARFGISAFVAHEDIKPTREWETEIENALATMDSFAALMTPDFRDSEWTDHEVGFARSTGVPMIAVDLGMKPYGFTARFQALSCEWDEAAVEIAKILFRSGEAIDSFIAALDRCTEFANMEAQALGWIDHATEAQVDALIAAYNKNNNVHLAFGFNGTYTRKYGDGLIPYLHRWTSRRFQYDGDLRRAIEPLGTVHVPLAPVQAVDEAPPF